MLATVTELDAVREQRPDYDKYQAEKGHTRLANGVLEALYSFPMSGAQLRIVLFIIRKTYGFNRKSARLTLNDIAENCHLSPPKASKYLKQLVDANIIKKEGQRGEISLNKYDTDWLELGAKSRAEFNQIGKLRVLPNGQTQNESSLTKRANSVLPNGQTHENDSLLPIKNNIKTNIVDFANETDGVCDEKTGPKNSRQNEHPDEAIERWNQTSVVNRVNWIYDFLSGERQKYHISSNRLRPYHADGSPTITAKKLEGIVTKFNQFVFQDIVRHKCNKFGKGEWKAEHLHPKTLFGENMDKYIDQAEIAGINTYRDRLKAWEKSNGR